MIEDYQAIARRTAAFEALKGKVEHRELTNTEMEFREQPGGIVRLGGYASITEVGYDMGEYTETMARGFAKRTLGEQPDVVLLVGHGGLPLARTRSAKGGPGTLRLHEDDRGLGFEADLDAAHDHDADLVIRKLRRGDLDGQMSIAFKVTSQTLSKDRTERRITGISLHQGDLSLVVQAANPHAMASLRAKAEAEAEAARAATAMQRRASAESLAFRDRGRLMQLMADPSRGRPVAASPAVREDYYTRRLRKLRRGE